MSRIQIGGIKPYYALEELCQGHDLTAFDRVYTNCSHCAITVHGTTTAKMPVMGGDKLCVDHNLHSQIRYYLAREPGGPQLAHTLTTFLSFLTDGVTACVTEKSTKLNQRRHAVFTVTTVTSLLVIFRQSRCAYSLYKSNSGEHVDVSFCTFERGRITGSCPCLCRGNLHY